MQSSFSLIPPCSFKDCLTPCLITLAITLFILAIIHIIIYFQLVKLAKKRFGIENFQNLIRSSYCQINDTLILNEFFSSNSLCINAQFQLLKQ
jgi:hypothetical protein